MRGLQPPKLSPDSTTLEELFKWKDLPDFGIYSRDSKFFDKTNKKVIGKMKDEFCGVIVTEFFGLKSKKIQ